MTDFILIKPISLVEKQVREAKIRDWIEQNPGCLGLGDGIKFIAKERTLPRGGGRLDLLLEDSEENKRYAVEIQRGELDASHLVRALEYWDWERARDDDSTREHCAVIIAEQIIGSRFFNVAKLLSKRIPLLAYEVKAAELQGNSIGLLFSKVLDESNKIAVEESASKEDWMSLDKNWTDFVVGKFFPAIKPDSGGDYTLNYVRTYISVKKNGKNALYFCRLKSKNTVRVELPYSERSPELEEQLEESGFRPTDVPSAQYYWFSVPIAADLSSSQLPAVMKKILEGGDFGEQEKESNAAD